ncbi:MAG: hypothetical protein PHT50_01890 [Candidatus Omnitrophica bacterium]|nr:hypothetical protein [Candidatus Omnitrophota bacterium]
MEIIAPDKSNEILYPVAVFKESWGLCIRSLKKLSLIYIIFNLPIIAFYFTPVAEKMQAGKPSLTTFLLFFVPALTASIWCHISLLLAAKKTVGFEDYEIGESIAQTKPLFFKYLGTVLLISLFILGVAMFSSLSVALALTLLLKINKLLATLVCLALGIAIIASAVYLIILWSLAATVCVLENLHPIAALKRSTALVGNRVLPVVFVYSLFVAACIICLIPFVIAGAILGIGGNAVEANQAGSIYSMFINIVLIPFWSVLTVMLYKKLQGALETNVYA